MRRKRDTELTARPHKAKVDELRYWPGAPGQNQCLPSYFLPAFLPPARRTVIGVSRYLPRLGVVWGTSAAIPCIGGPPNPNPRPASAPTVLRPRPSGPGFATASRTGRLESELRRAYAREQVQWVRSVSPKANEMVQWTISIDERPKGSVDPSASLASLEEGPAFLSSLCSPRKARPTPRA